MSETVSGTHSVEQAGAAGFEAFRRLARIGAATAEIDQLLAGAAELAVGELGLTRVTIYRLLSSGEVVPVISSGHGGVEHIGGLVWRLDERPLFKRAWLEDGPVVIAGAGEDPVLPRDRRPASVVALRGRSTCLGFIAGEGAVRLEELGAFASVLGAFLEQALEQERLHRLDDLKSHFIALASHELRAPVAVIHGIGVTLNAREGQLEPDDVVHLHAILNEQTEHLAQLVNQLLDLSRLEANAIKLEKQQIKVRDRIEEIVRTVAPEHARAIEVDVEPDLETVVDPAGFERIVSNLVTNAIRYGAPPIRIGAQQRDTHFRLTVEDRGDGVSKEFVPRLFERFTRSDEAAPRTTGSGLGLAIAQSYANAHGGELLYESAEPRGARFELVLPRPHPGE